MLLQLLFQDFRSLHHCRLHDAKSRNTQVDNIQPLLLCRRCQLRQVAATDENHLDVRQRSIAALISVSFSLMLTAHDGQWACLAQ
jgi:hypothetical protein